MPDVITRDNVAQSLGPANANATAQQTGGGIGIQNIRRGVLSVTLGGLGSNITVTHGTSGFAALSTPLQGEVYLSGRPLLVMVQGVIGAGASGSIALSVTVRGVDIVGTANGLPGTYTALAAQGVCGFKVVTNPAPGRAVVAVTADATTADGAVYVDGDNSLELLAVEL